MADVEMEMAKALRNCGYIVLGPCDKLRVIVFDHGVYEDLSAEVANLEAILDPEGNEIPYELEAYNENDIYAGSEVKGDL